MVRISKSWAFGSQSSVIELRLWRHRLEHKSQPGHLCDLGPQSFHPSEPASLFVP